MQRSGQGNDSVLPYDLSLPVDTSPDSVITATVTLQGYLVLSVFAVDLAGNDDKAGRTVPVVVVSQPPATAVTSSPPPLTNASSVSFAVTALNGDPRVLSHFQLRWSLALASLPSAVNTTLDNVTSTVDLSELASGAYTVSVSVVDVLGNAGAAAVARFVVDLDPPTVNVVPPLPPCTNHSAVLLMVQCSDALSFEGTVVMVRHWIHEAHVQVLVDDWIVQV